MDTIQLVPDSCPVHLEGLDTCGTALLKGPENGCYSFANQFLHPLDHDNEIIAPAVHEVDISLTEVATIQDKADMPVAITFRLLQHEL